jgi:hypothetical protein
MRCDSTEPIAHAGIRSSKYAAVASSDPVDYSAKSATWETVDAIEHNQLHPY